MPPNILAWAYIWVKKPFCWNGETWEKRHLKGWKSRVQFTVSESQECTHYTSLYLIFLRFCRSSPSYDHKRSSWIEIYATVTNLSEQRLCSRIKSFLEHREKTRKPQSRNTIISTNKKPINLLRKLVKNDKEQFDFGGVMVENRSWCGQTVGVEKGKQKED